MGLDQNWHQWSTASKLVSFAIEPFHSATSFEPHHGVPGLYHMSHVYIIFLSQLACKDSGTSTVIDTGIFVWPFHAQRYLKLHRPPDPYDGGDLLALWSLDSGVEDLEEYRRSSGDFRSEVQMHWMGLYLPQPYRTCL